MRLSPSLLSAALLIGGVAFGLAIPSARAEETCPASSGPMMTKMEITKSLQDRGYATIRNLSTHNACWEAKGIDKAGKRFELELNGHTGAIVNAE